MQFFVMNKFAFPTKKGDKRNYIFYRPGVDRAVLQTPPFDLQLI